MRVYLAEKKQQGEVIAAYLDKSVKIDRHDKATSYKLSNGDYVTWCEGHLYELAMPDFYDPNLKNWSLDNLPFRPSRWQLLPKERVRRLISVIDDLLSKCSEVVLCSDFDREGQYLGLNAIYESGYNGRILRAKITSLGKVELGRALNAIEDISLTMPLYYSALARAHADYLVGINLTRFFTCLGRNANYREKVNVGRVITPTIQLIVERDNEIAKFVAKSYYELEATLSTQNGSFKAKWQPPKEVLDAQGYCLNYNNVKDVESAVKGKVLEIVNVEKKHTLQQPPLPFSLSDLQVYCGNHFKMTPSQVLEIAQKLYDNQYTSYPRTDCSYIPESQHQDAVIILGKLANNPAYTSDVNGCNVAIKSKAFSDAGMGDSSHNAIIPTTEDVNVARLSSDELKVYDIICKRYIAQFYVPAEYDCVVVTAKHGEHSFRAVGRVLTKQGYRIIFTDELLSDDTADNKEENAVIPPVNIGEKALASKTEILSKKTRAPKRYKQTTLVNTMKHVDLLVEDANQKAILKATKGIGTEATRAGIIKNLFDYGWVCEKDGYLYGTVKAHQLMAVIPKEIKSPVMTAMWEEKLNQIANRHGSADNFENEIYSWLGKLIAACMQQKAVDYISDKFKQIAVSSQSNDNTVTTDIICPLCSSPLKQITGKDSKKYWVCTNRDNCKFITNDKFDKPVIERCVKCNGLLRQFKFNNSKDHFWKCQNEQCGAYYNDIAGSPLYHLPVCPKCGKYMRFSGNYDRDGHKQAPYFYCEGYKDKSCYCKLDRFFKEIKRNKTKVTYKD